MRFSLSDTLVTFTVAVLSVFLLVVFFNDLNAISSRGNETPLGTIFFKKQTATRKSSDSQIWERLRNQSPVYAADTLRTDEDSEAVVNFDDGLSLDMLQNSMLKLTTHGTARNLDFQEGSITLQGGGKGGAVMLGQNGRSVTLSDDAQLVVTKTKDTTSLELSQGTAQISDANGQQQTLNPETALDLNDQTGAAVVRAVDLIPQSPAQGARLLSLSEGAMVVTLAYKLSPQAKLSAAVVLELSQAPDFSSLTQVAAKEGQAQVTLEAGTWYWRVASGTTHSSVRQFSLSREVPLVLTQPADGAEVTYRKKQPPVRFSWTAGEHVAFWDLELSRTGDFSKPVLRRRATVSSLSLDGLAPGPWSWRVVAHYGGTVLGNPPETPTGHFTITQKPQMTALVPTLPIEGTLVQTQEATAKGLAFTWDPPPEAQRYTLSAARSPSGPPVATFQTTTPYRLLTPQDLGPLAAVGATFWSLRWVDDEGNLSPPGPPRTLRLVDGELALRPTFPPDGYQAADQFLTNTRFSWKSNLAARTVFQASRSADFKNLVTEVPVQSDTLMAGAWGPGTYFWRLVSYNANGSVFLQTAARRLEVVPPFPAVTLGTPEPGKAFLLPEHQDQKVSWSPVPGADDWELTLLPGHGGPPLFQTRVPQTQAPEATLPLAQYPEGTYTVRLQAFAHEKPTSTSVIGLWADSSLSFRRLVRTKLLSPPDGALLDGLDVRRHGLSLVWDTPNLAPDAALVLTGPASQSFPLALVAPVALPHLAPGRYSWTVRGSIESFDVSAARSFSFTVAPIPKLPPPPGLAPAAGTSYGPKDLRKLRSFPFAWAPVPKATAYRLSLTAQGDALPVWSTTTPETKASLPLTILHGGAYRWTVEALTTDAQGDVEQEGEPASSTFVISLPTLGPPKLPEGQTFYGR